jgi:hypothetical protein
VWHAFDEGAFRSNPRIRAVIGNWKTNIGKDESNKPWLQGRCFQNLVRFYVHKVFRDPRPYSDSELEVAAQYARVLHELANVLVREHDSLAATERRPKRLGRRAESASAQGRN